MNRDKQTNLIILIVLIVTVALIVNKSGGGQLPAAGKLVSPSPTPTTIYSEWAIESLRNRSYDSDIKKESGNVVSFVSEGLKQYALMLAPSGQKPASGWPVIILNHGHITPSAYSTVNSYKALSEYYPRQGFVMIKPDYRGHGTSQGESESLVARIGYSIDVLNLLAGVEKLPDIDKSRIYMWGHSMGGEVTLRVLEVTNKVKSAVLWAPAVREWPENALYFSRRSNPERAARLKQEYDLVFGNGRHVGVATLDLENLQRIKVPVLVQHATGDASVPYEWGVKVVEELRKVGIKTELITYQGDDHNIVQNRGEAQRRDIEWFENYSN